MAGLGCVYTVWESEIDSAIDCRPLAQGHSENVFRSRGLRWARGVYSLVVGGLKRDRLGLVPVFLEALRSEGSLLIEASTAYGFA